MVPGTPNLSTPISRDAEPTVPSVHQSQTSSTSYETTSTSVSGTHEGQFVFDDSATALASQELVGRTTVDFGQFDDTRSAGMYPTRGSSNKIEP